MPPLPLSQQETDAEELIPVYRVLLAEDNPADVMVLEEILLQQRDAKFEIAIASDGQQAIQLVKGLDKDGSLPSFDIALVDLNLPKHTGHEVLATIRKAKRSCEIPVIIVTSSRSPTDIKRARDLGANEYFEKVPDLDAYSALGPLVVRTLQKRR
jgi:CheY-like chemotaxis protein